MRCELSRRSGLVWIHFTRGQELRLFGFAVMRCAIYE